MEIQELLFHLIRYECCETSAELDSKTIQPLLPKLYALSQAHDVVHLVSDALVKLGMLGEDKLSQNFKRQKMVAVLRYERINFELERICQVLETGQIPFIPLKGAVLRSYYPEAWMRTSCDIDVLVAKEHLEDAARILTKQLEYRNAGKGSHDISMFSPGGVHVELHYELIEDGISKKAGKVLSTVWDQSHPREGSVYYHELTDEVFYFYHVAHMAKHVMLGGCGIRSFLDLWLMDHRLEYNIARREKLLADGELLTFARVTRKTADVWFSEEIPDEIIFRMQEYILQGGIYGTKHNRIVVGRTRQRGQIHYALGRIFLPYNVIKYHYPILQKYKWLLPFMELRRWGKLLFTGGFHRSIQELNKSKELSPQQIAEMDSLLQALDLQG